MPVGTVRWFDPKRGEGRTVRVDPQLEVARRWVEALERGDVLGAVELYAPDARLHAPGQTLTGRAQIHGYLASCSILGTRPWNLEIRGDGDVVVRWDSLDADAPPGEARTHVAHGEITEQRIRFRASRR